MLATDLDRDLDTDVAATSPTVRAATVVPIHPVARADKTPQRPTPYDDNYRPKPLRDAIAAAFESAPKRT